MANTIYQTFKTALLNGSINLSSATIYVALLSAAYTPNFATDQFLSTISGISGAIVARSAAALAGVSITGGALSASPIRLAESPDLKLLNWLCM
jgi:hypothetical protein